MKLCICGEELPAKSKDKLCASCQNDARSHRKGNNKRKEKRVDEMPRRDKKW